MRGVIPKITLSVANGCNKDKISADLKAWNAEAFQRATVQSRETRAFSENLSILEKELYGSSSSRVLFNLVDGERTSVACADAGFSRKHIEMLISFLYFAGDVDTFYPGIYVVSQI